MNEPAYGYDIDNPICVRGFSGEAVYQHRLRTVDGEVPLWNRLGSSRAKNGQIVDIYDVCFGRGLSVTLYVNVYGEPLDKAPSGFVLLSEEENPLDESTKQIAAIVDLMVQNFRNSLNNKEKG